MTTKTEHTTTKYGTAEVDLVTCDGCDRTMPLTGLVGWVEIVGIGVDVAAFVDRPLPLHACSQECARTAQARLSWFSTAPPRPVVTPSYGAGPAGH